MSSREPIDSRTIRREYVNMKRAVRIDQKEERREAILREARKFLESREYDEITLADVAERLGLVKGTLYRYFPTRETLFLELCDDELGAWFESARESARVEPDTEAWIRAVSADCAGRKPLLKLVGRIHVILERNVESGRIAGFKAATLERIEGLADALSEAYGIPSRRASTFILEAYVALVGLAQIAFPPESVKAAIATNSAFAVFAPPFEPTMRSMLRRLLLS